jgi:hypothetical protein
MAELLPCRLCQARIGTQSRYSDRDAQTPFGQKARWLASKVSILPEFVLVGDFALDSIRYKHIVGGNSGANLQNSDAMWGARRAHCFMNQLAHTTSGEGVTPEPREALGRLFLISLRAGSTAAVRAFIARGVSPNARDNAGRTPLMIAAGRVLIAAEK